MHQTAQPHADRIVRIFPDFRVKDTDCQWGVTVIPNGDVGELFIDFRDKPGRWLISGTWPRDRHGNCHRPDNAPCISVSLGRTDEQIRADFLRRFWTPYTAAYPLCVEAAGKVNEAEDNRQRVRQELADLCNGYVPPHSENKVFASKFYLDDLLVNHDGSRVRITLDSVPLAAAKQIIVYLKTIAPAKESA